MSTIKGKTPVSAKESAPEESFSFNYGNLLDVPENIRKGLEEKGLACRWINAAQFRAVGAHQSHWQPYKVEGANSSFGFGIDAEGYIRRADLVLGVRPLAIHKAHQQFLKQRNDRLKGYNQQAKQDLRNQMGDKDGVVIYGDEE